MPRTYRLRQRAERQNETRQRIVEAAVELHTTLGPARTSILAIAERAGVERPTVYRHFPTAEELFTACSAHYQIESPQPDPEPWLEVREPDARLRRGLGDIYAYYTSKEMALWCIFRDFEDTPELRQFGAAYMRHHQQMIETLIAAWPEPEAAKIRAAIGHAADFFAWRSLRRQGLSNEQAVEMMVALVNGVR